LIAYVPKEVNDPQKNYDAFKLKMYAMVKAVQYFHITLAGVRFGVRTGNMILRYWKRTDVPAGNIFPRWRANLASFDFGIEHKDGVTKNHRRCA
jgi:hypothetical protein